MQFRKTLLVYWYFWLLNEQKSFSLKFATPPLLFNSTSKSKKSLYTPASLRGVLKLCIRMTLRVMFWGVENIFYVSITQRSVLMETLVTPSTYWNSVYSWDGFLVLNFIFKILMFVWSEKLFYLFVYIYGSSSSFSACPYISTTNQV